MAAQPPPATANFSEGTPPDDLMPESRSAAFAVGAGALDQTDQSSGGAG